MSYNVSVVIPVLNGELTIVQAINSVLSQTNPVFEIVVVDNGSTDGTRYLVNALNNMRVKLVSCDKRGVAAARNYGIKFCRGDWVAFLDADDQWNKTKIQRNFETLNIATKKNEIGMIFCLARNVSNRKKPKVFGFSKMTSGNMVTTSGVLLRIEIARLFNGNFFCESSGFAEDWGSWIKVSMVSSILFVPEVLVIYSRGGLSKYSWDIISNGICNSFGDAIRFSESIQDDQFLRKLWRKLVLNHVMYLALASYALQKQEFKFFIKYSIKAVASFAPTYYWERLLKIFNKLIV